MLAQLVERAAIPVASSTHTTTRARLRATADAGFEALPRFIKLAAELASVTLPTRSRWNEPPVFFFDRRRQAELETARPAVVTPDPCAEIAARIREELPALCASLDVRRVARAVSGLCAAAETLAPVCAAAKELAELLAVPDEEVFTVLHPGLGLGFRLHVCGVADVGQFQILMRDAAAKLLPSLRVMSRFVTACREANPTSPAGVPLVAESRFQLLKHTALLPDGTMPAGVGGSDHWLWPHMPLARVPRVEGERVVLLGEPAYRATWEVTRRFPAMAAEVELIGVMQAGEVRERLNNLTRGPRANANHRA